MRGILGLVALVAFAGAAAGQARRDNDTARLIRDLRGENIVRREAAARRLIGLGPDILPHINGLLDSQDPVLATQARRIASALVGVAPEIERRVLAILTGLSSGALDLDDAVGELVAEGKPALDHALDLLRRQGALRGVARRLYIYLEVEREIRRLQAGDNRDDRARDALARLGTEALGPLARISIDSARPRGERLQALWVGALADGTGSARTFAPLLADPDPILRNEAALVVAEGLDVENFEAVARFLPPGEQTERLVVAAAAARRLPVASLVRSLSGQDERVVTLAAEALGLRRDASTLGDLRATLGVSRSSEAAGAIVRALAEFDTPAARETLEEVFAGSSDAVLRADAVRALASRSRAADSLEVLLAALFDPSVGVRLQAADALALLADRRAVPGLLMALDDTHAAVRARSLSALTRLAGSEHTWDLETDPREEFARWWQDEVSRSGPLDDATRVWRRTAAEGARILNSVREAILTRFYSPGPEGSPDASDLARHARSGFLEAFEKESLLDVGGLERAVLRRVLLEAPFEDPDRLIRAAGCLPVTSSGEDLVRLTTAAATAMVEGLGDRYSRLILSHDADGKVLPEWSPGLLGNDLRSNGFSVERRDEALRVHFVLQGGPAHRAGFRRGDQIVALDGAYVSQLSDSFIEGAIRKDVTVSILRDGWNRPYDFHLIPEEEPAGELVRSSLLPGGLGYVQLRSFDSGAAVQIERALRDLERQGIVGLIFDLRNNPGGSVAECVSIVDKFVDGGRTITMLEGPMLDGVQTIESTDDESDRDYPLAVLVNSCSASAAEMCAGSLQQLHRATVVGQTSYGKGIGQGHVLVPGFPSETVLGETRSRFIVYLTELRYLLPGGKAVHGLGVQPDIAVEPIIQAGNRFDVVMRVSQNPALERYVQDLLDSEPLVSRELAGRGLRSIPGLDRLGRALSTSLDGPDLMRLVRHRIRDRLATTGEGDDIPPDYVEDRELKAAIRAVARAAGVAVDSIPDYAGPLELSSVGMQDGSMNTAPGKSR